VVGSLCYGIFVLCELFLWYGTNIADVMHIADISENFCELHGIFGEIIALYVCQYCARKYMYRENSREVHIVSGKPARCTYMGIYGSLNLNLNLKS